jgi:DNA-binding transcriptional regulator YiaG
MYTKAELFSMAAEQPKEIFVNNITLSVPDDADSCLDLDAEKEKLSSIWDLEHLSMRELVARTGLSQTSFAKRTGIPLRTVQTGVSAPATARHTSASCWPSTMD